ncbi:MAG TPA: hypothetical protein VGD67_25950 [Pseudonocardiaceae bacterium]
MSDDDLDRRLRALPPELPPHPDRFGRVRARVDRRRRGWAVAGAGGLAVAGLLVVQVAAGLSGPPRDDWAFAPRLDTSTTRSANGHPVGDAASFCPTLPGLPMDEPRPTGTRERLVPTGVPEQVVICAYGTRPLGAEGAPPVAGVREISAGLDRLGVDLAQRPPLPGNRPCPAVGGQSTSYRLRLSYPDGAIWVATEHDPGNCAPASNGTFEAVGFGEQAAAAYATGTWESTPPGTDPCAPPDAGSWRQWDAGRWGQHRAMVPLGAVEAAICPSADGDRVVQGDRLTRLTDALNELPVTDGPAVCGSAGKGVGTTYRLVFRYPIGPSVVVHVHPGCHPEVFNGNLTSPYAGDVVRVIEELLSG